MNLLQYKIERLQELQALLTPENESLNDAVRLAEIYNRWFTEESIWNSINAIKNEFLDAEKLVDWMSNYDLQPCTKTLGIIMAGNIPLVGFHDLLCAFMCNSPTFVKLSSKDESLMRFMVKNLKELDITWEVEIVDRLTQFDAVIATGSDNSNRYFEQYFSKVPHILRNHRNSIAVLNGKESPAELEALAKDVFEYFGLGCRNVSKILVPEHYDISQLFPYFDAYQKYVNHNLYKDNYDYNRTLLLMNLEDHLANDFVMLKKESSLHSRLATLHYSFYKDETEVQNYLIEHHAQLQVVVSQASKSWKSLTFGEAQSPALSDYADHLDTMQFLLSL